MRHGEPDLRHHGDVDAVPGMLDFAVNVQGDGPPGWLRDRLTAVLHDLGRYPSPAHDARARAAVAARHRRRPDEVLLLAGSAEGFALLPALRPRLAAVLHPGAVPGDADLVVVGNPTNPTGVLHPADTVRALCAPGRVVLVDEAFADAVPGEPESVAGDERAGLLVFRSLTKTWALAGLRAGYALGAPQLLVRLAAPRPPWPVSTPAIEAVLACSEPAAVAEAHRAALRISEWRRLQESVLATVAGVTILPGRAPYLLLRLPAGQGERVRGALRDAGVAVRRGDTFPGLGPDHIRVAVRAPAQVERLAAALSDALAGAAAGALGAARP
jgi:histidinol-phosphate aminotransferase